MCRFYSVPFYISDILASNYIRLSISFDILFVCTGTGFHFVVTSTWPSRSMHVCILFFFLLFLLSFWKTFWQLEVFFLLHWLVTLFVHLRTCLNILQLPSGQSLLKLYFIPLGKRVEQIVLSNRVCFDGLSIFHSLFLTQNLFFRFNTHSNFMCIIFLMSILIFPQFDIFSILNFFSIPNFPQSHFSRNQNLLHNNTKISFSPRKYLNYVLKSHFHADLSQRHLFYESDKKRRTIIWEQYTQYLK